MGRLGVKSTLRKCTIQKMGNFGMETGEDWARVDRSQSFSTGTVSTLTLLIVGG